MVHTNFSRTTPEILISPQTSGVKFLILVGLLLKRGPAMVQTVLNTAVDTLEHSNNSSIRVPYRTPHKKRAIRMLQQAETPRKIRNAGVFILKLVWNAPTLK